MRSDADSAAGSSTVSGLDDLAGGADRAAIRKELVRGRRKAKLRANLTAYAFLGPSLIFFVAFLLVPIVWVGRQSFMEGGVLGPAQSVGLENWKDLFSDSRALPSLRKTFVFVAMTIPVLFTIAIVVALALREVRRGGTLVRAAIYVPSMAPLVLLALVWVFLVHPEFGLLNLGSRLLGAEPVNWLGSQTLALPTLAMLEIWRGIGFWSVFLLAGLLGIPSYLYQAASLDGASALRRFWHVTLPGLRPTLAAAVLLSTLFAMQVFESPFILTKGGPAGSTETAVLYIYETIFQLGNPGLGSAVSMVMLVLVLVLTGLALLVARRGRGSPGADQAS
jgi:ABC-type sugar transport system permease subunit